MRCLAVLCVLAAATSNVGPIAAADEADLKTLLGREIVGPVLPLAELQQYVDAHIPKMRPWQSAEQWGREADRLRRDVLDRVVYRGEANQWRDAPLKVVWLDTIEGGPGYSIRKLRYEALPGLWIPALLYQPDKLVGKVPAVLNVNGHTALGKQYPPKQIRCINQAKRGMLALNVEWLGMGQLRTDGMNHSRMNQLDLCGTSGLAPFYLAMKRGLDVLAGLENADPKRLAVTGLSGGGWQTILLSSLDQRVKLCNPVAGYSSLITRTHHMKDVGDSEQIPVDLATLVDYTHLTAMMAPRPTLLTYNSKDNCCFESGYALPPLIEAGSATFALFDRKDAIRRHINDDPGDHNYEQDNRQAFYRMAGDFFFADNDDYDAEEIRSDDELKTAEQLHVEIPPGNRDFHTLAAAICKQLPRDGKLPAPKDAAKWRTNRRDLLRKIVKFEDHKLAVVSSESEKHEGLTATFRRLRVDDAWTLPAVELVVDAAGGQPTKTALLIADGGRRSAATDARRLLDAGYRVLLLDPVNLGESRISQNGNLFPLMISTLGRRSLGLQAGQIAAVARWCVGEFGGGPIALVSRGPRCGVAALVAAAMEEKAIGRVELHESLGSLKEVIHNNWTFIQGPELFCFGLLEAFDIEHLAALVAPRPVRGIGATGVLQLLPSDAPSRNP